MRISEIKAKRQVQDEDLVAPNADELENLQRRVDAAARNNDIGEGLRHIENLQNLARLDIRGANFFL
jgi:hypothetical protein